MKHKVGDKVKVKSLDWYNENKDEHGTIFAEHVPFCIGMKRYCGEDATIICVLKGTYRINLDNGANCWTSGMFEEDTPTESVAETVLDAVKSGQVIVESVKNDRQDDKLMWELLPLQDIEDVVKVYTTGAKKYGPNRWQNLPDGYNRYKAAMLRHLVEYEKGNRVDKETGCLHLAQVVWNAIAMLHYDKEGKGLFLTEKQLKNIAEEVCESIQQGNEKFRGLDERIKNQQKQIYD